MKGFTNFPHSNPGLAIVLLIIVRPVYGQTNTLCTASMLRSFNPCINFVTDDARSSPIASCCNSLKSLMSSGRDCLCLIITGGTPIHAPINRTLAASLPRTCKTTGVPIECKAMGSPPPAPGPTTSGSGVPPRGSTDSAPQPPSWLPEPNGPALTPPGQTGDGSNRTPPEADAFPTMTPPGIRPDLSAALSPKSFSEFLMLSLCGVIAFMYS